ncbi:amino acid ABC transporter ATP-binding/permease protein [Microbacterium sp.]|uniref:amino acid ABC transporter ATP-binding/permease protein n=1 Tax=Microbacterium sp. TaxID=51671 RepID=UPI003C757B26
MSRCQLAGWLIRQTRTLLAPLIVSVLARIAGQLLGVALFVVAAAALGRAAAGEQLGILPLVAGLVGIALLKAGLRYLEHYSGHWVAFAALQRLRELFFARLVPQAPAATTGRAGADLTERATRDIDRIEVFFAHTFPPAVSAVVVPMIALTWLGIAVSGILAACIAPFVLLALLAPMLSGRATWRASGRVAELRGQLAAQVGDDIQGVREVLGFGAQRSRLLLLDSTGRALTNARGAVSRIQAGRTATVVLLQSFALIVTAVVATGAGAPASQTGIALAVAVGLWVPVRGVEGFVSGLDAVFAATARVREVIEGTPAVAEPAGERPLPAASTGSTGSTIVLDGVTVRHPGRDEPALREVTARFDHGAWSIVVGVSGSGKSTLATLLVRGLDPDDGTVRIDGVDLRELTTSAVRGRVALVSQHPTLLSGTIDENLRLAAPDAEAEAITEALAVVALDDWVATLPEGTATRVDARGVSVSGGQLQRLAIARALIAEPAVLVLDEALSQLDADTAGAVRQRLAAHRSGVTVVEITHRADLVPDEAPVLVLDGGRVVQHGTAGTLRDAGGALSRLEARN